MRVRMYRQGLGDCFLLTFPGEKRPSHMLVDCGVLLGTEDGNATMSRVARDIHETTGGRLDVVAATHEHWDHVSGFLQARAEFDRIQFAEVWFAWTEDGDNPLAKRLRRDRLNRIHGLRMALEGLGKAPGGAVRMAGLRGIMEFHGPAALGARRAGTADAFEYLKNRRGARICYLYPNNQPLTLRGVDGVRIYVLGPPEDEKLLRRSRPTRSGAEVYEITQSPMLEDAFLAALPSTRDDGRSRSARERTLPFEEQWRIPRLSARRQRFFGEHYGFGRGGSQEWRRIDTDWMTVAEELALNLDGDTNNTSLVLAIELVESGRVILLAADAQIGNWESWSRHRWRVKGAEGATRTVTSADLLRRTVLYKVGHHGSHNATLRAQGLELMEHPELVAMIPVEAGMAEKQGWNMPFPKLLRRLEEKTRGRVIRGDRPLPGSPKSNAAAWQEFRKRAHDGEFYVDYEIPL